MKRILIGVALLGGIMFTPAVAGATKPDDDGFHKVTICHNVSHNPHAISIDVAAVAGSQETKHGFLTLNEELEFVSFVPHDSGGHDQDFFLHIGKENKPEDDESCNPEPELLEAFVCFEGEISVLTDEDQAALNLKVAAFLELNVGAIQVLDRTAECEVPVATTTTTTAPPVVTTTTTAPPVTDTTPPSPPRTAEPVSVELLPTQPVAAPTNQLPHTGLGDWLWITGAALLLSGIMMSLVGRRIPA